MKYITKKSVIVKGGLLDGVYHYTAKVPKGTEVFYHWGFNRFFVDGNCFSKESDPLNWYYAYYNGFSVERKDVKEVV